MQAVRGKTQRSDLTQSTSHDPKASVRAGVQSHGGGMGAGRRSIHQTDRETEDREQGLPYQVTGDEDPDFRFTRLPPTKLLDLPETDS